MKISVIVSTYNNPKALEKSLWGWQRQADDDFEILIADDGSRDETRRVIELARDKLPGLKHVWHEDKGFRKNLVLNKAIQLTSGDYLIFSDGDCIPRNDFVSAHRRYARPNYFLAGGSHIDVPEWIHERLVEQDIASQVAFKPDWLISRGMPWRYKWRLTRHVRTARVLDFITSRIRVFTGANASCWKQDALAVNGFDASSTYGSDDKEFGVRLANNGVKSIQLKHSLVCLHQSHSRPYPAEQILRNKEKLRNTRKQRITWIDNGIESLLPIN